MTHWRIDKRIPVSVILMLVVQLVTAIAWAGYVEARVNYVETTVDKLTDIHERLARIEERVEGVKHEVTTLRGMIKPTSRVRALPHSHSSSTQYSGRLIHQFADFALYQTLHHCWQVGIQPFFQ